MKRATTMAVALGMGLALMGLGSAPASADTAPPPNAIVSEGNGAAVFIGYGVDRAVNLSWRPSKKYEGASMLFQVQRGDGAMLESRTAAASFKDVNLLPNTAYGYNLISYLAVKKTYTITKGPSKGQTIVRTKTKRVGTNRITVLTLPSMVVNLKVATVTADTATVTWEPPQYMGNPVTYSVVMGGNVMAYGMTGGTYTATGLACGTSNTITVVVENAAGEASKNAQVTAKQPKCA